MAHLWKNACGRTGVRRVCHRSEGFPTITKQRILGGKQQMLRLDTEVGRLPGGQRMTI